MSKRTLVAGAILALIFLNSAASSWAGTFDWRSYSGSNPALTFGENYVTPIRDQDWLGSCWAHGAAAVTESRYLIASDLPGVDFDLSEEQMARDCSESDWYGEGADPDSGIKYIHRTTNVSDEAWDWTEAEYASRLGGVLDEATLPYQSSAAFPPAEPYTLYTFDTYVYEAKTTAQAKSLLKLFGPLLTRMYDHGDLSVADWYWPDAASNNTTFGHSTNHVVTLVGYTDDVSAPGGGYWIVKNSYGTDWGDNGYGYLSYAVMETHPDYGYITSDVYGFVVPEPATFGDYNNDGLVEQGDLDLVLLNWGSNSTPTLWVNDLPTFPIDSSELDVVRQNWGSTTGAPANSAVPEPASLLLIVMGLSIWRKGAGNHARARAVVPQHAVDILRRLNANRIRKLSLICFVAGILLVSAVFAAPPKTPKTIPEDFASYAYASDEDMQWFKDAKFGIFLCWGPCSLVETEIGWGRRGPRGPNPKNAAKGGVPKEEYDTLYKRFNPTLFDADAWIKMIHDAGAKYMIFLTKHHDGFCLFDAKNTNYKITNTPFGRDVCKELADACHKYGVKIFWYYSQPDWHHPDFLTENQDRCREYVHEHVRMLLTDYGKIDGIWFDCLGTSWKDWDTPRLVKMIRTLQPGIIINQRWGWGVSGLKHQGDFDTPEQQIGKFQVGRPWETCATMGGGWSWRGGKKIKTSETCTRMLIQCAGSGGNLALDTGPRPDGLIHPPVRDNYLAIGRWLKVYGDSIYATQGGPYKPGPFGVSTHKENKIYLHILSQFAEGCPTEIYLPALSNKVVRCSRMGEGKASCERVGDLLKIKLEGEIDKLDNIVVLELDGSAKAITPIDVVSSDSFVAGGKGDASSIYSKNLTPDVLFSEGKGHFEAGIHHKQFWAPSPSDKSPWLTVSFDTPVTFNYITLAESIQVSSVRKFPLEYDVNGTWKTLFEGDQIGLDFALRCNPTTTSKVRLKLLESAEVMGIHIQKLELYNLPRQ